MIQPAQIWHWMLNGLHGLADMMAVNGGMKKFPMNAEQKKRLKDAIDKLNTIYQAPETPNGQGKE